MKTDTRLIPLTQGQFSIVDAVDYEFLMQWSWYALKVKTSRGIFWYACRKPASGCIYMHREIARLAGLPKAKYYDHKDRNRLNNTRSNIRPATPRQSLMNRVKSAGKTSQYKGVCWDKSRNKWMSYIHLGIRPGQGKSLGRFDNELDAARAYEVAAMKHYGEFACLK